MRSRGSVWRRRAGYVAVPLVVALSSVLLTGAAVAFSSTTSNPTSSFSAGTLTLDGDNTATASLTAPGPTVIGSPGATVSRCFPVDSTGSLPATVKLYDTVGTTTNALSTYITVTITQGTGTSATCGDFAALATGSALYSGTLSALAAKSSYATGLGSWALTGTGTESRDFRVDFAVASTAPNTTQNSTTGITLTWEAQTS